MEDFNFGFSLPFLVTIKRVMMIRNSFNKTYLIILDQKSHAQVPTKFIISSSQALARGKIKQDLELKVAVNKSAITVFPFILI